MEINTIVKIGKVDISKNQEILFNLRYEQQTFFDSKLPNVYNCNYIDRSGSMVLKGYVENIRKCNYGYYTNTYNGISKRYYFWILKADYLAKETTKIEIAYDLFQTWLFEITFEQCFIERAHIPKELDTINYITMDEDFEIGQYITQSNKFVEELQTKVSFIIAVAENGGQLQGSLYSGLSYYYFDHDSVSDINNFISNLNDNGKIDSLAYIFSYPWYHKYKPSNGSEISLNFDREKITFVPKFLLDDYKPHNKKLLQYPYRCYTVENSRGEHIVLRPELFNYNQENGIKFFLDGNLIANPVFALTTLEYNGDIDSYANSITEQSFGLCSWINDNYSNWYAQHINSISNAYQVADSTLKVNKQIASNNYNNNNNLLANNMISNAMGVTANGLGNAMIGNFSGAIGGAITGGVNTYLNYDSLSKNNSNALTNTTLLLNTNYQNAINSLMSQVKDVSVLPNTIRGDTSGTGLDIDRGTCTFNIKERTIQNAYAQRIDKYFDMFGYKINKLDYPDNFFNTRNNWNYVKTTNCLIRGNIPREEVEALENIFNEGITLWHNYETIYKYNTNE